MNDKMKNFLEDVNTEFFKRIFAAQMECLKDAIKVLCDVELIPEVNGTRCTLITQQDDPNRYTVQWDGKTIGSIVTKFPEWNPLNMDSPFSLKGSVRFEPHGEEEVIKLMLHRVQEDAKRIESFIWGVNVMKYPKEEPGMLFQRISKSMKEGEMNHPNIGVGHGVEFQKP